MVPGDESWIHYYWPEMKMASKEWRYSSSPKSKEFHTQASAGKLMLTLFWDHQDPLVQHDTSKGTTILSAPFCSFLRIIRDQPSDQNIVD
jgi:hypothetical protein